MVPQVGLPRGLGSFMWQNRDVVGWFASKQLGLKPLPLGGCL